MLQFGFQEKKFRIEKKSFFFQIENKPKYFLGNDGKFNKSFYDVSITKL